MEKILKIEKGDFQANERTWGGYTGYIITTTNQVIRIGISNTQECCESWGCVLTSLPSDLEKFIGEALLDIKVSDILLHIDNFEVTGFWRETIKPIEKCGDSIFTSGYTPKNGEFLALRTAYTRDELGESKYLALKNEDNQRQYRILSDSPTSLQVVMVEETWHRLCTPEFDPNGIETNKLIIDIRTQSGLLQIVAFNSHNGYYCHEAVCLSNQLTISEDL